MFRASWDGDLAMVKHLVEEVHINLQSWRNAHGHTPFHWAVYYGHLDTVRYFVEERSCDVMCRDRYGDTPLHVATIGCKLDTVQYLISKQSSDPMCRGQFGRTALHQACNGGHLDVVKYFD